MKKAERSIDLKQPWANQLTVGNIEIRVLSRPNIKLQELEGVLKSEKKAVSVVRELREEDYGREKRRTGSC
jgi:hypothetical protein